MREDGSLVRALSGAGRGAGDAWPARGKGAGGGLRRVEAGGRSAEPFFQYGGEPQTPGDAGEYQCDVFGAEAAHEGDESFAGGALLCGGGDFLAKVDQFADETEQACGVGGRSGGSRVLGRIGGVGCRCGWRRGGH